MDRVFLELFLSGEEAYTSFSRTIESANVIVATYRDEAMGDVAVYPELGNVCFGSGLHNWGFTLSRFARLYAKKFGIEETKMMKRLWGDQYFNSAEKKWTTSAGPGCKRGFTQFVFEPIQKMFQTVMNNETEEYEKMLKSLNIKLKPEEAELTGKALIKVI